MTTDGIRMGGRIGTEAGAKKDEIGKEENRETEIRIGQGILTTKGAK